MIGAVETGTLDQRPIIWSGSEESFAPGRAIGTTTSARCSRRCAACPERFPGRIRSARASDGMVTLVLDEGMEIRLGDTGSIALKLAVAPVSSRV